MIKIGAVILAAGLARRMGQQKLLLPLEGKPLLAHVLARVAQIPFSHTIAVIGEPRLQLEALCQDYGIRSIYNSNSLQGQSTSMKLGLSQLPPDLDGFMFLQGDQPLLSANLLERLIYCFHEHPKAIIVPSYKGEYRSPALFGALWQGELEKIDGDRGGRSVIKNHLQAVIPVEWDEEESFWDTDTQEDYERLVRRGCDV